MTDNFLFFSNLNFFFYELFGMEFTVIDASVIRASCALTDRSTAPADKENYDELITKFKDINKLDLSSFSKCILYTGYCTYNYLFHQIIKKKKN